jgi:hypothetical protein
MIYIMPNLINGLFFRIPFAYLKTSFSLESRIYLYHPPPYPPANDSSNPDKSTLPLTVRLECLATNTPYYNYTCAYIWTLLRKNKVWEKKQTALITRSGIQAKRIFSRVLLALQPNHPMLMHFVMLIFLRLPQA